MKILEHVYATIAQRRQQPKEGSYTNYLQKAGLDKMLKKVSEEAGEVIIAAKNTDTQRLVEEVADLLFHITVVLEEKGISLAQINAELENRHKP